MDDWLQLPPAKFHLDGKPPIYVMLLSLTERGGNRLVRRARPFQRGVKLDGTGEKEDEFTTEFIFHNDLDEGDVPGPQMWPDRLEELIRILKKQETGTLDLPWKQGLRVRADNWERRALATDNRGGEVVTVVFVTDNEDTLDRAAFKKVSVKATLNNSIALAQLGANAKGLSLPSMADLQQLASQVAALINAPGDMMNQLKQTATALRRACLTVVDAINKTGLTDPAKGASASELKMQMLEAAQMASLALAEAQSRFPPTKDEKFKTDRDLASIAAEKKQSYRDLLSVNDQLADPSYIPADTAVKVFK